MLKLGLNTLIESPFQQAPFVPSQQRINPSPGPGCFGDSSDKEACYYKGLNHWNRVWGILYYN